MDKFKYVVVFKQDNKTIFEYCRTKRGAKKVSKDTGGTIYTVEEADRKFGG